MTHILVTAKLVPDLVEELEIADSGTALDMTWLRLIINEFDDHAIEQAILLKEKNGGEVTVVVPDMEGMDDVLFTAAAKGADRLVHQSRRTCFRRDVAEIGQRRAAGSANLIHDLLRGLGRTA